MNIRKRQQRGSAALITTIAISTVLIILFVGATTIATRQIRQSINSDNASRATYAAEAGVEDAVRRLSSDPNFIEPTCNAGAANPGEEVKVSTTSATSSGTAWTCRTVTQSADELTGRLAKDETLQLNLSRATNKLSIDAPGATFALANARYMTISWNNPSVDAPNGSGLIVPGGRMSAFLPAYLTGTAGWNGRPAAIEITSTWLPNTITGAMLTNNLKGVAPVRTVIASPVNADNSAGVRSDFSPWNYYSGGACTGIPAGINAGEMPNSAVQCWPAANQNAQGVERGALADGLTTYCSSSQSISYSCVMPNGAQPTGTGTTGKYDLTRLMRDEYDASYVAGQEPKPATKGQDVCPAPATSSCVLFLRLKARYNSASYSIRFFDDSGNPVFVPDGFATIDVTARSNNYFHRVVAKKRLAPNVYDGVFDNALFSGTTICKTMQVYKDFRGAPEYTQEVTYNESGEIISTTLKNNTEAGKNSQGGCVE